MRKKYLLGLVIAGSISLTCCRTKKESCPEEETTKTAVTEAKKSTHHGAVLHLETMQQKGGSASATLKDALQNNPQVVVDFFAVWCGPCKQLSPIVDRVAKDRKDILFIKVDVDKSKKVSEDYGIQAMPTLLYFKNGKQVHSTKGGMGESGLRSNLTKAFGS